MSYVYLWRAIRIAFYHPTNTCSTAAYINLSQVVIMTSWPLTAGHSYTGPVLGHTSHKLQQQVITANYDRFYGDTCCFLWCDSLLGLFRCKVSRYQVHIIIFLFLNKCLVGKFNLNLIHK